MKHLETNEILADVQYGFRSNHSCETQLFLTTDDLTRVLEKKLQIDVAILHFEKAFDKVAHTRLIHKLHYYGIRGDLLQWIESFLTNHTQRVVVNGTCSSPRGVTSGVPQGSVLGPILFLIYINDITSNIDSQLRLFADDCLFYRPINSPAGYKTFQDDLYKLSVWADVWQMRFNVKKCCILATCIYSALY